MKYIEKFKFRLDDMDHNGELKNEAILKMLESIAGYHSDKVGYGYQDLADKKVGWILIDWYVEVLKRPKYQEELTITTWGRKMILCYTYRDFEMRDESGELCVKGTSKWTLLDIEQGKLAKLTEEIVSSYEPEEITVFEEELERLKEPENYTSIDYKIHKNEIDNNGHLHNTYYLNLAYEALPDEVFFQEPLNHIRITYKKEIKYGEMVECHYAKVDGKHTIAMIRKEDRAVHAIVQLW